MRDEPLVVVHSKCCLARPCGTRGVAAAAGPQERATGSEMLTGRADAQANMRWRNATVVENKCATLQASKLAG